jgi:LysM repeat protein
VADSGDTYASISEEMHLFNWQLPKYNEQPHTGKLQKGEFVYLQPKRNKAYGKSKTHMVSEGETMHSISQRYGIKEAKLRKRNRIEEGKEPEAGAVLLLRGHLKEGNLPVRSVQPKKGKEIKEEKPEFEVEFDLGG